MPKLNNCFFLLILLLCVVWTCDWRVEALAEDAKTRPTFFAGSFYPAEPQILTRLIDGFLEAAGTVQSNPPPVALISPHAGYEFSGHVAAEAYATLQGNEFDRVVVISPCHVETFPFNSIYNGEAYATPLGDIPVDKQFAKKLARLSRFVKMSDQGHVAINGRGEHALEVQLPFLQRVLGEFKLVPVVMGQQDYGMARALGASLAKLLEKNKKEKTLIVASSDLSHYHPYEEAVQRDRKVLTALRQWDYLNLSRNFERGIWEACGGGPVVATMIAAERLQANSARLLKYANSGDVPAGGRSRVVGYGAVTLSREGEISKSESFVLEQREKQELVDIARQSVEEAVRKKTLYQLSTSLFDALTQDRGAFVTLKKEGQLRGCIGSMAPAKPLGVTVRDVAVQAALLDRRFKPVAVQELSSLEYEISVLSPLRRVLDVKQIKVGRDGLLIKKGKYEGVLLPQIATEYGWNRRTLLEETCLKAGLPKHAWRDEDTDIFAFTVVVFGDLDSH